jgi:hypothetical protein
VNAQGTTRSLRQTVPVDASVWANLGVAVGTGVLAGVTFWLGWQTRASVREAERQTELSQDALQAAVANAEAADRSSAAAWAAVKESAKARGDAAAANVVVLLEPLQWPPLWDAKRSAMPYANELRMLDSQSIHGATPLDGSHRFYFPQDAATFLWFRMRGLLINEGRGSARVRLDGEARFINEPSPFQANQDSSLARPPVPIPAKVGTWTPEGGLFAEYVLRPYQEAVFEWAAGHTLQEWADAYDNPTPDGVPNPHGRLFFTVLATDQSSSGSTDSVFIEAAARPIKPVLGQDSVWALGEAVSAAHMSYPKVRRYPSDDQPPTAPPWAV